ncbi:MAG: hypothetical protein U9O87_04365 [Verrucomicrobiota bacterium]|nr:hypothetical protein [Verrucomicrobiota bacterium]
MKLLAILITLITITGCTSMKVPPVPASLNIKKIIIQKNPKLAVSDYLPVLREGFDRHGISTYVSSTENEKDFFAIYTALRSWDLATFLSHAEIKE